jgi:hypothetical protein
MSLVNELGGICLGNAAAIVLEAAVIKTEKLSVGGKNFSFVQRAF